TPKKAAALNEAAKTEGAIDTESRVVEHENHIAILHAEMEELLKRNKITVEKLNIALKAVFNIQHMVLNEIHSAHIIPIPKLNMPGVIDFLEDGTE
ncbi:4927_t:CDS:1, partial [Funneliformis caledonium]